jgi:diguanylate cyclase
MINIASFTAKTPRRARLMILLWATILAVICGAVSVGEPLEMLLRNGRSKIISHEPSGKIVIVGFDDSFIKRAGGWPLSNGYYAKLIRKLNALGAERIVLNDGVAPYKGTSDDQELVDALRASKSKVVLTHRIFKDMLSQKLQFDAFAPNFGKYTENSVTFYGRNDLGYVSSNIYGFYQDGRLHSSVSKTLSSTTKNTTDSFPIDTAVRSANISTLNPDFITSDNDIFSNIHGKIVFVGSTSLLKENKEFLIGTGSIPTIFIDAVSVETLLQGTPKELPWFIGLILSFMTCFAFLWLTNRSVARIILALGIATMIAAPVFMADRLIFIETATSYLFLLFVAVQYAWLKFTMRRVRTNPSTGLPNLNAFRELKPTEEMAVIAVRLANYAEISAILPPQWHDELTIQIVRRLTLGADGATIYQGEDGIFGWVMADKREMPIHDTLDGLHALFSSPLQVDARRLDIALTFGIDRSHDRSTANRFGSALVAANDAAKAHEKWREYDPATLDAAEWKLSLVGRLDDAIDAGEIWVAYQPKLDIDSGVITSAEALVRWSHPERGEIGPVDFVMAAEAQNRIGKLTEFVLDQALSVAATIQKGQPSFTMAVNLSGRLLTEPTMIKTIKAMLRKHKVKAETLTLEITESAAINSSAVTHAFLTDLRRIGVKIAIDDYGTGFSTLDYVTTIPANEIKIDRRFVSLMGSSQSDRVVVNSTIQLAHQLGRIAVAEGVEDAETLATLRLMGCDIAQGYFIARPITQDSLMTMLSNQGTPRSASSS